MYPIQYSINSLYYPTKLIWWLVKQCKHGQLLVNIWLKTVLGLHKIWSVSGTQNTIRHTLFNLLNHSMTSNSSSRQVLLTTLCHTFMFWHIFFCSNGKRFTNRKYYYSNSYIYASWNIFLLNWSTRNVNK